MKSEKSNITNCYQLLQNVLQDAFQMQTLLFTYPYEDIRKIDLGMRAALWTNYSDGNTGIDFVNSTQEYRLLIVKSNLGFYNLMAIFGSGEQPDFIAVGPFRDEELSPNYFTQILKESHVASANIQSMKHIYERMPLAPLDSVLNVMKHIISVYIPEFKDMTPKTIQFSEQKRAVDVNSDMLESFSQEYAEKYQEMNFSFLELIKRGDTSHARDKLHAFLYELKLAGSKNMREYKLILHMINDYCQMALFSTDIHPLHIIKQSSSLRAKIEHMTSLAKLEQMPNEICHKYCLLVKNYANPDCSKLTKDVMTYVQLHMDEELSLSRLATHFNKNSSVLSNTFSKEVGQSLTHFIHQTRIHQAIRLFNTTSMTVSEVAMAVGYPDFSYFSKVFSKTVGCSPREYKQRSFFGLE